MNGGVFVEFHKNKNLNECEEYKKHLSGISKLILIKHISSFIIDVNQINSIEIRNIILELKKGIQPEENIESEIKSNLIKSSGKNILSYSNYVSSMINDKILNDLLALLSPQQKMDINFYWKVLSLYEEMNEIFEKEILKAIEKSYFEYSIIGLSMSEQRNRKSFLEAMKKCPRVVIKNLFHGTVIDPISKIITNGFLYPRRTLYGMGITFSDMLDYTMFYSGGKDFYSRRDYFGKVLPVNETFSCVCSEVYYDKNKIKIIFDFSLYVKTLDHFPTYEEIRANYPDKMVEKNGIHLARVEPYHGKVRNKEEIFNDIKEGKFIGTELVITELDQILPLYGLTFKRDEYLIIWRDPHFHQASKYYEFLEEKKLFICEYAKFNAYFESSIEKALEIIIRKQKNKIILISNVGLDLSGKKFVDIARKILGFNIVVLFFSENTNHLNWLKKYPNALFSDNIDYFEEYITNYNKEGLLGLKGKMEKFYKIKFNFEKDFLDFPKFINEVKFSNLNFEESSPNFKKFIIKNMENDTILCMNDDKGPFFDYSKETTNNLNTWYVTIIGNEITLFCDGSYLGANINTNRATKQKYMVIFKFEKIKDKEYLIYYDNKENVLTSDKNNVIIQRENPYKTNQKFKFVEVCNRINDLSL